MRFYLDENLSPVSAELARAMGIDITSAAETGRYGTSDADQLQIATAEGRCIVTRDYGDFSRLAAEYTASERTHAGILFVPTSLRTENFAGIARVIARYDREHPHGIPPNHVDFLPSR